MDPLPLSPADLQVESFETATPETGSDITKPPTGMKTYEPGCTTPELCGGTLAVA